MKKYFLVFIAVLFLTGQAARADRTAIIGGLRSGLALGIETVKDFNDRVSGRFGLEATTGEDLGSAGENPFIMFVEGQFYLFDVGRSPVFLSLGLLGDYGYQTAYGASLSFIFNKIYGREELFLETGIDYISSGTLRLQIGYKLY